MAWTFTRLRNIGVWRYQIVHKKNRPFCVHKSFQTIWDDFFMPNFALDIARTGCTSAKSKLSAFGLHCPCSTEQGRRAPPDCEVNNLKLS